MDRKVIEVSSLSLSFSDYLPTYLSIFYVSIYLSIYQSIYLSLSLFLSSVYLSSCLSVYPSIYLSVYLSIYLSAYLSTCLSIYLSIYLSICLSIYLSLTYLSIYLSVCLSIYLSMYRSMYLSMYLSIYLSICLSVYLSNISAEDASCTAPATKNASVQILFKSPTPAIVFENATKPWRFSHFSVDAQSTPPATQNDVWTSKMSPRPSVFNIFYFQMCFAPQRRPLFRHLNFQNCSEPLSF